MATTAKHVEQKASGTPLIAVGIAAILGIVGLAAWVYQLTQGMQVTGLNQQVVWGLYIAAFFTAVGGGAALVALAGLSAFTPILSAAARVKALVLSLAAFFAGAVFIAMDVGNPLQIWRVITSFRFNSLMTWDFWLLAIAAVVAIICLLQARSGGANKVLGALAIAAGVVVVAVEGWMLSTLAAHQLWGSGFTVVAFLVNAAVAGFGLAALVFPKNEPLRKLLLAALGLSAVLVAAEVLSGLVSQNPRVAQETRLLLTGAGAPVFWLHVVAGIVLPLALIALRRLLSLAGVLALIGVAAEKVWFLSAGQAEPLLPLESGSYLPSALELVAVIGIAGLAAVVFWALLSLVQRRPA